jgi:hypothetical protein
VHADVLALLGREPGHHPVDQLDEVRQQPGPRPRVPRVLTGGQAPLGEVHRNPHGPGRERLPDVLLALVDERSLELLAAVTLHRVLQRVQQSQHRGCDHRLLHRLRREADRLLQRVCRVLVVGERPAEQLGQLTAVAVGEDREELPARAQHRREAGARERGGDGVGGEARPPLLTVGDDRRARGLHLLDGVLGRSVLQLLELGLLDLTRVELAVGLLELRRSRQRTDVLRGDAGVAAGIVVGHVALLPIVGCSGAPRAGVQVIAHTPCRERIG